MNSIFELFGTIAINNKGANKGIDETSSKAKKLANTFGQIGQEAVKVGKTVAKGMAVISAAGAAAASLLLKSSIGNYAEYQQLVGGIETLFGAGGKSLEEYAESVGKSVEEASGEYDKLMASQDAVLENSKNAYKTAGLSANEYMATATSFAASLLQGLGGDTAAAATMTDMAIQDMADNANKMGTDISMIQNAYQGFAKRNYTMLDNLKLGYGGTATEMARLINDSGVMGETFVATAENLNEVSFAKMIEAIHVVQKEMGITGTTTKEAEKTITGSFNAWKAAGSNLLTAIASGDKQSMSEATAAFTAQTKVLLDNLKPVVSNVISSIGTLLTELWPDISAQALDFGSEIIAQIINGITGSSITSEDVKSTLEKLLDVGETALGNTLSFIKDTLAWISENKETVILAVGAIGAAFLVWKMYTDPIGTTIQLIAAGLALLVTNWEAVKNAIAGAIAKIRTFLGLSPTVSENQEEYLALVQANAEKSTVQKYAGRYAHWTWEQRSAAEDLAYNMAQGRSTADDVATLKELGLDQTAIDMLKQDVSEALASVDFTIDNLYVMFEPSTQANLQAQLNAMPLKVDVMTGKILGLFGGIGSAVHADGTHGGGVSRLDEDGSHASGIRYVPRDDYLARLHLGEIVLPRHEADEYRSSKGNGTDTSRLEGIMQQVLGIMQQVAANTASGQNIVLDTGAMVGQLAPRLDAQLGILTARKERRG